jgi:hypothetical protein
MGRCRLAFASCVSAFALAAGPARADDTFGLAVHVAETGGAPVQDEAWIREQIAGAEKLYAPLGVHFRWAEQHALAPRFAALETREDRNALATEIRPKLIDVMVVRSLRDVDEPDRYRMGVCWRPRPDVTYVILASTARPTVLAHELGHYFGNGHSTVVNNIMSYSRSDGDVFLSPAQVATVKATAQVLVARGLIVPLPPPRIFP